MSHELAWTAPQPFWKDASGAPRPRRELVRPQILRFTTDEFVNELLATLERDPASLPGYAVMEETWRGPGAVPASDPRRWLQRTPASFLGLERKVLLRRRAAVPAAIPPTPPVDPTTLKLYQPAHLRHYLVGGSLVCQTPGLPDKQIDPARHKVSFVLRRLLPKTPPAADVALPDPAQTAWWDEYAYVPRGKAGIWQRVAAADRESEAATLPAGEERLALFPAIAGVCSSAACPWAGARPIKARRWGRRRAVRRSTRVWCSSALRCSGPGRRSSTGRCRTVRLAPVSTIPWL